MTGSRINKMYLKHDHTRKMTGRMFQTGGPGCWGDGAGQSRPSKLSTTRREAGRKQHRSQIIPLARMRRRGIIHSSYTYNTFDREHGGPWKPTRFEPLGNNLPYPAKPHAAIGALPG